MLAAFIQLIPLQPPAVGLVSVYDYVGDKWAGPPRYACQRRLTAAWGRRGWLLARAIGVASRSLPCGTRVQLCRLDGRCATAIVVDRGPYGALTREGWKLRAKLRPGERWRGYFDLRPPVAARLGLRGIEPMLSLVQ